MTVADQVSLGDMLTETSDLTRVFGMTVTIRNNPPTLLLHNGFSICKTTTGAGTRSSIHS